MAKEPLIPARAPTTVPVVGTTHKDQKGYQLDDEYNALQVNQEFDRLHKRINDILVEASALSDLATDGSETVDTISAKVNSILVLLRQSGLLKSS